jgi:superfamily II DNA or RNA helicase
MVENLTVKVNIFNYTITHPKFIEKTQRFTGSVNRPGTVSNLVTIGRRNKFIVDMIDSILENKERKILVLSERVEHLKLLKNRLDERKLATSGYYVGGMKQSNLDLSAKCTVIFGTFQMASEALDIKGLNTLVMTTGRREIEQTIGRITRDPNTLVRPLVVDIVDDLPTFVSQGYYRRNFYRKKGFQILLSNVLDNNIMDENDISLQKPECNKLNFDDVEILDDDDDDIEE